MGIWEKMLSKERAECHWYSASAHPHQYSGVRSGENDGVGQAKSGRHSLMASCSSSAPDIPQMYLGMPLPKYLAHELPVKTKDNSCGDSPQSYVP